MSNSHETRDDDANRNLIASAPASPQKPMRMAFATIAICAGALALVACDKTPTQPPAPKVESAQIESGASTGPAGDTSVPSADSVLSPANATKADPTLGRSNKAMSAAQESTAMPMPGQNNDHSAPLGPAKGASTP